MTNIALFTNVNNKYQFVDFSSSRILPQEFDTEEEAFSWWGKNGYLTKGDIQRELTKSEFAAAAIILRLVYNDSSSPIVVSRIADNYKLTRTSIVSALKKLDNLKIISSRSLGMKGTSIEILKPEIVKDIIA